VQAVRLFQGYLWHPKEAPLDPRALLPGEVLGARLLLDEVPPPTPFFEDGTPTHTQRFYCPPGWGGFFWRTSAPFSAA